jgi:acyl-CoA synthetase (AMP-forming)/AMP-acid ligase II
MAENVFAVTQTELPFGGPKTIQVDAQQFRSAHRIKLAAGGAEGSLSFTSSGKVLPGQHVQILDESGGAASPDCVGEICIQSDCLFEGYFNRPDLNALALIDGWYRTGDLGFLWEGELFVVGRKKDLLIIGGENIYPQDIEEIVCSHPDIHDGRAIAFGVYNPGLGTEDVVVVAEIVEEESLARSLKLEQEIRRRVVAGLGVAVRTILLKPPKWIVKSTAGKPARAATREKLLNEHPELNAEQA